MNSFMLLPTRQVRRLVPHAVSLVLDALIQVNEPCAFQYDSHVGCRLSLDAYLQVAVESRRITVNVAIRTDADPAASFQEFRDALKAGPAERRPSLLRAKQQDQHGRAQFVDNEFGPAGRRRQACSRREVSADGLFDGTSHISILHFMILGTTIDDTCCRRRRSQGDSLQDRALRVGAAGSYVHASRCGTSCRSCRTCRPSRCKCRPCRSRGRSTRRPSCRPRRG